MPRLAYQKLCSSRYGPEPEPDVRKWQREHGESTGRSDLFLVITEGGEEIKIPVSRAREDFESYDEIYYAWKLAPDFYRAIFAMKDAGKEIKLHQYFIMHFPDWYIPLSDAARAPYIKHSSSVFADFMTEYGKMKDDDKIAFSSKHLALSRYLLSFYPGTPGGEGP